MPSESEPHGEGRSVRKTPPGNRYRLFGRSIHRPSPSNTLTMQTTQNKRVVVCDIDGTVSVLGENRARLLRQSVVDWNTFYADPFDDEPISKACTIVRRLIDNGVSVIFSTSRRESVRGKTIGWLREHICEDITDSMLLMRPDDCYDDESVQKVQGVLSRYTEKDIAIVLDDNENILRAWKNRHVPVLNASLLQS